MTKSEQGVDITRKRKTSFYDLNKGENSFTVFRPLKSGAEIAVTDNRYGKIS